MELNEESIKKYLPQIKQVCEEFKIDDYEEVLQEVIDEFKSISDKYEAKGMKLPEIRYFNKALGKVCSHLGTFDGQRFELLVLGFSRPRDWNAQAREAILKAWHSGAKAQANIKKAGQIATMTVSGKPEIVSHIDRWGVSADGKYFVMSGKVLEGDEDPIPIDTREYLMDNKTKNKRNTYPLDPRWNINMYGLVNLADGIKQFEARIYGDYADPTKDKYLPRVAPAFKSYKAVLVVDTDHSTNDLMRFSFLNAIEAVAEDKPMEQIIYDLIDQGVLVSYKKHKGNVSEADAGKIFVVDLDTIEEFHSEVMCQHDEHGDVVKTKSGYDATHWNRMAIGVYYLITRKETKTGNYSMRFRDWTNSTNGAFSNEVTQFFEVKDGDLPHEVFISFRTNRKKKRWDKENRVEVEDLINGDVTIGTLMGINLAASIMDDD